MRTARTVALLCAAAALSSPAAAGRVSSTPADTPAPAHASARAAAGKSGTQVIRFGRFGNVTLYQPAHPARVVLFVSGDGGWNEGVVDMAKGLAALDALVIGIDIRSYLEHVGHSDVKCASAAGDFEALSQYVQKSLDLPRYIVPILCGYSSGATLVYAVAVQAPTGTFAGAVSLSFCPDLSLAKPMCKARGLAWTSGAGGKGVLFEPAAELETPWIVLQGARDEVCSAEATEGFVRKVHGARLVRLPQVGHGFSVPKNWMPQLAEAVTSLTPAPASAPATPAARAATSSREDLSDLPLVEVPPAASPAGKDGEPAGGASGARPDQLALAVIVTGDGGWAGLDREVSRWLADRGIPVVGLNSLQYFWTRRTPDGAAADLARILRSRLPSESGDSGASGGKALLIGYSRGADVLPFMAARLPAELAARVSLVALLGPSHVVDFQFHVSDWLGASHKDTELPVLPEVKKLDGARLLCVYGEDESDTICPEVGGEGRTLKMAGGHHFGGDYAGIAAKLLEAARK